MIVSYVVWQNSVLAIPKNLKFKGSLPYSRIQKYFKRPGPVITSPKLGDSLDKFDETVLLNDYQNSAHNSNQENKNRNCYVLWFHHDVPQDLAYINDMRIFENSKALHKCTFAHVFTLDLKLKSRIIFINLIDF